ncbi:MAG TPA: transposase [Candidatus Lokiarchaeia archaeon]|nr:transposase [Candidatus Lokiarchaeia archaeon]
MELVEQIQVRPSSELSELCHHAKILYNVGNFHVRQFFFLLGECINYYDLQYILKDVACYRTLPAQTNQQVLKLLFQNWRAFFAAVKEYKICPSKFMGRPRPPGYKPKDAECVATFTNQNTRVKEGQIHFPKSCHLPPLKTRITHYKQVRVIPHGNYYTVEVVYEQEVQDLGLDKARVVGIDLGLSNLVTIANNVGTAPRIIKGGAAKAVNQFYNKQNAKMQSQKDLQHYAFQTKRQQQLLRWRANQMRDVFHKVSRRVVAYCIENNIGSTAIGHNAGWKQGLNLGRRTNQNFVQVPFSALIHMIEYKAQLVGISVIKVGEAYTSRCSFIDGESVEKHAHYCGRRVKRGLFLTGAGKKINADVNAALNILKKAIPEAFCYGIVGLVTVPCSLSI